MLELITMSILGACYMKALADERIEEQKEKEEERIRDLKIKVFCYAIRHNMLYNQVVDLIQINKLTIEEILRSLYYEKFNN